uniref:YEATS domain-containing protein 2 n=1 Tax=Macaca nemestrina TaxID=9545 RepID=A0A2K6DVU4_MACNE
MSGIKRTIKETDPDYEDVSVALPNKRHKAIENSARDAAVQKIETIIKEQFALEMKNKEHEIEVIDQRLIEARRMMDKLRACIVANYYASAGLLKVSEGSKTCDTMVFNHPAIKKFLESPSRSSSPANQRAETPSANHSESDSLSQHNDFLSDKDNNSNMDIEERLSNNMEQRPSRNTGRDASSVTGAHKTEQRNADLTDETSRLFVKKTIVVGNVSKYIPPDKREENDQSTHKWMVYVRGSRREPSINHFVKKVWFFLHPSYKPNDLVEVREPPFHLTRRGWGEFPVRVQVHFKDSQNKRIDIIHNLKLDRTYTGLQTLGAETVVDVELHRHSLGEDYIYPQCSESDISDAPPSLPLTIPAPVKASSPIKQSHEPVPDTSVEKGFPAGTEAERHAPFYSLPSSLERTPTKMTTSQKVTFCSHGNSAFQPIASSCKIVPQSQVPNPESPGKSFQPITMSCKIVSGSPISTPSPSPLPRTPTSTPVHVKQGTAGSVINNPYVIMDKQSGQMIGASTPSTGSPTNKISTASQVSQGTGSPVPKIHGSSFVTSAVKQEDSLFASMPPLCPIGSHPKVQSPKPITGGLGAFTKVIIKQEPGEAPHVPATGAASQSPLPQYVTVKGGHMIAVSPQKQVITTGEGIAQSTKVQPSKVVGVPVGSALPSTVKQAVAISGGQILVAKASSSVSKAVGPKQVVTQGVAKAIVSGGGGTIVAQPVQTLTKAQVTAAGPQKSGSQGSVMATLQLPATNLANLANLPPGTKLYLTTNSKNPSGKGKLLLIPQGAILRATNSANLQSGSAASGGSGAGGGGGGGGSSSGGSSSAGGGGGTGGGTAGGGTQSTAGPGGISQHLTYTSYILKQTPQLRPQTSTSQVSERFSCLTHGGQASLMKISDSTLKTMPATSQLSKPGTTMLRVAGGVITTATSPAVALSANGPAQQSEGMAPMSSSTVSSVTKTSGQPQVCVSQTTVGTCKAATPTVVSATSLVPTPNPISGKATVSGLLKIHSSQASPQQAVLTIPSQLKPLSVNTSGGVQTILMPVNKVVQSFSTSKPPAILPVAAPTPVVPSSAPAAVAKVKTEPETPGPSCLSQEGQTAVKTEESSELGNYVIKIDHLETIQQLLTAVVKKIPLITAKSEDASCFSAKSVEQYYGWNIGKRRAAEWQRAMTMRKVLQEILEKNPRFHHLTPLKTKHIAHWCRCHGYTPPDPESLRNDGDSIEDVLTQIDSEPVPIIVLSSDPAAQFQKTGNPVSEPVKITSRRTQEEKTEEVSSTCHQPQGRIYWGCHQKIGITLQPVDMILKVGATEQLVNDILRQALAVGYQTASHNRIPKEITVSNIHQAICNIPFLDFLTNKHMGILNEDQ